MSRSIYVSITFQLKDFYNYCYFFLMRHSFLFFTVAVFYPSHFQILKSMDKTLFNSEYHYAYFPHLTPQDSICKQEDEIN